MPDSLDDFDAATNQITLGSVDYDNAGNQTDGYLGEELIYDANNRQTSYTYSSATTTYH